MFMPISMFAIVCIMNKASEHRLIYELSMQRQVCLTRCTEDNFPTLSCDYKEVNIEYNGVSYQHFYVFPNPNLYEKEYHLAKQEHYDYCKDMIRTNENIPQVFSMGKPVRQWKVHTCFEPCKKSEKVEGLFTVDERPICDEIGG
jgi:hypothetical protein